MQWFSEQTPVLQALIGTLFTWGLTALGAAMVFFFVTLKKRTLDGMLGFAAGVMIAASFWSLLNPAIELADSLGQNAVLMATTGFLSGGLFLYLVDKFLPHLHLDMEGHEHREGVESHWRRSLLLVLAITIHNIPEGMAVGVAFGALGSEHPVATLGGAISLALGIGIQNFPEGAAVSIPLRREGFSRAKAFYYGQLSGVVEPMAGVLGAFLVLTMKSILPFSLAFAAGAMIYVVAEELIPEAHFQKNGHIATWGVMVGFAVMMLLDVALG